MEQSFFDTYVNPLGDKVNAMYLEDLNQTKAAIEAIVKNVTDSIDKAVDNAFADAEHLINGTIDEIKNKIIDTVSNDIQSIEDKFFQGVKNVLHEIEETVDHINCAIKGDVQGLRDGIL